VLVLNRRGNLTERARRITEKNAQEIVALSSPTKTDDLSRFFHDPSAKAPGPSLPMLRTTNHKRSFEMTKQTADDDPVVETYRRAFDLALDQLILTLKEAQDYLGGREDLASIGTLALFDEQAEDMKAALRLFRRAKQDTRRQS
jgi:hypothetical protein